MYVGRIVAVGASPENRLVVMYRVSSRSFPDRCSVREGTTVLVIPRPGRLQESTLNPYIAYDCLRSNSRYGVAANGIQTGPIMDKLIDGMQPRDAVLSALAGLDYEHDDFMTPRIAAVADKVTRSGTLGIIRHDAVLITTFPLKPGQVHFVATYVKNSLDENNIDPNFQAGTAEEACDYVLGKGVFRDFSEPILAASALENDSAYTVDNKDIM